MYIPTIPFKEENDKIKLTGPVFLSCGCGQVTARWATLQQQIATNIPQGKPKSSKMIWKWIQQELPEERQFKQRQYGVLVAETDKGFELVDVMAGATPKVLEKINDLIKRNKEWTARQSSNS